ncbi:MAG: hypothetical protein ACRDG7_10225 [Candidatus Limnocylindria bacterium]
MAAIVGAVATVLALVLLFLRRTLRWGELGTVEDEPVEERR